MCRRLLCVCLGWLVVAGAAVAQEAIKSGPQVGDLLPGPFHPYNATGAFADRPHCLVCEYGLQPVVALFTREFPAPDSPLARLLQALDAAVEKHRAQGLRAFVVVLTNEARNIDARKAAAQRLKDLAATLMLQHVVLSLEAAAGPDGYNLAPDAALTALAYFKHKVEANFAFRKDGLREEDITAILTAAAQVAARKP